MDSIVSTQWLDDHRGSSDLKIIDSSWFMPASGRDGRAEYTERHIPGAVFFDIEALSDTSNPAPHMMPRASEFAHALGELGIAPGDRIVVYDNSPLRTAARGWFMLRHFGACEIAILDGGLGKWRAEDRPTQSGESTSQPVEFEAQAANDIVTKAEVLSGTMPPLIDARGAGRFDGSEADPRPGVAPGHIPGSRNLPFASIYRADGTFKEKAEIRTLFEASGIDPTAPFVATCGSGVTATSLVFAAHMLGNDSARLYDGSWSEWGADPTTPKAIGPA